MKILHMVYSLIRGGTEGQCARTVMALAQQQPSRHKVAVFRREGFFVDDVERLCGPVYKIGIQHMIGSATIRSLCNLRRYIKSEQIGLVHAWDADAAIFGSLCAYMTGIPHITSRRDLGQIYPAYKLKLMKWADTSAQQVVVNAHCIAEALMAGGMKQACIHSIPNMLNLCEFDKSARKPLPVVLPGRVGRRVVVVNRLDPEKDVPSIVMAFKRILEKFPDAVLILVGDGVERSKIETLVRVEGLKNQVTLLGHVDEVPSLLIQCDLGVLFPSKNEGLSNTIMEYMAAGLPVVASDCGGNRELVEHGKSGWVVPSGDVGALADAMTHLLAHEEKGKEMGRCGRMRIQTEHDPERILKMFMGLYGEVLK